MRRCIDCPSRATHQGRCKAHWEAYRARPGVRARQRRADALRAGQDAAAQLRKKLREDIKRDIWAECAVCGRQFLPSQVDIDHITPLHQGGEDVAANLQILCSSRTGHFGCHETKTLMDAGRAPF